MGDMFGPALRWPLSIAVMMMLAQQLSGEIFVVAELQ